MLREAPRPPPAAGPTVTVGRERAAGSTCQQSTHAHGPVARGSEAVTRDCLYARSYHVREIKRERDISCCLHSPGDGATREAAVEGLVDGVVELDRTDSSAGCVSP